MIVFLRTLVFHIVFYVSVVFVCLFIVPPLFLLPARMMRRLSSLWVGFVLFLLKHIIGMEYKLDGLHYLPSTPCLIASKHQSMWETLAFCHFLPNTYLIAKRELLWIPLFGWGMQKAGLIALNRNQGASALRALLHACRQCVARNQSILIFPEGTRRPIGSRGDYLSGVAAIYRHLDLPCVPVALNSGLFWPRRSWQRRAGMVQVHFLPMIAPGLDRHAFMQKLEDAIESKTQTLI